MPVYRDLRYPDGWPGSSLPGERPRETGVDVALAVDYVALALEKRFDVGVIMSLDTDILPALEYVVDKRRAWGRPVPEVAAWRPTGHYGSRLSVRGARPPLWCHWLDDKVYAGLADGTDYSQP